MPLTLFNVPTAHRLIGGKWTPANATIPVSDPSTGLPLTTIGRGTQADIHAAITAAKNAMDVEWGAMTALDRGRILTSIGKAVLTHVKALSKLESRDVGKPLTQAHADAVALVRYFEFYGGAAVKLPEKQFLIKLVTPSTPCANHMV